jgi:triosephosphate isomerase
MKFIIANWKMNLTVEQSIILAEEYLKYFKKTPAEVVVCPSFTSLPFIGKLFDESPLAVGAQNVSWEKGGAFTGEVSPVDLVSLNVGYVIIGHSERRLELGEEDWMINRKIKTALETSPLCPVLCIGEGEEDNNDGDREVVLGRQLDEALDGVSLSVGKNLIVAYEPVWAIGSGETPELSDIEYMSNVIKVLLRKKFGQRADDMCAVLYGGSVNPTNSPDILALPSVDGLLVGGASLKVREFYRIVSSVVD